MAERPLMNGNFPNSSVHPCILNVCYEMRYLVYGPEQDMKVV